jgi:hypothetical protein
VVFFSSLLLGSRTVDESRSEGPASIVTRRTRVEHILYFGRPGMNLNLFWRLCLVVVGVLIPNLRNAEAGTPPYQNSGMVCVCQCNAGMSGYLCPVEWDAKLVVTSPLGCDSGGIIAPQCKYLRTCPSSFNFPAPSDGNCSRLSGITCAGIKHPQSPGSATQGITECSGGPVLVPNQPSPPSLPTSSNPPFTMPTTAPNPWMPKQK